MPLWFELTRVGNVFTGYYGTDGTTWTLLYSQTISMNTLTLGGLVACSNSTSLLATTQFSSVSVTSANTTPTVATPAAVFAQYRYLPNTANLSVLGADDAGESNLTYTWSVTGTPPAPVTFTDNGTNTAKNTIATFTKAGTYNLQVTITDSGGLTVTSPATLTVYSVHCRAVHFLQQFEIRRRRRQCRNRHGQSGTFARSNGDLRQLHQLQPGHKRNHRGYQGFGKCRRSYRRRLPVSGGQRRWMDRRSRP